MRKQTNQVESQPLQLQTPVEISTDMDELHRPALLVGTQVDSSAQDSTISAIPVDSPLERVHTSLMTTQQLVEPLQP